MDKYKVKILTEILNNMQQDKYYLCKVKGDNIASINIDEEAINLLIQHYSK